MIELIDVHKSFDGTEILKGISAKFESGKTSLIIGQSGSGKTVLMKSLIGLHRVDQGQITRVRKGNGFRSGHIGLCESVCSRHCTWSNLP